MMFNLSQLNPQQRVAAKAIAGPVLILAGAGSGKTKTLTARIGHMIKDHHIDPKKVLAVTFTNKAAGEMRSRVKSLLGSKQSAGLTVSTFHALGVKILREEIHRLGYSKHFTIYDQSDQMSLIRQALRQYRASKENFDRKILLSMIGKLKNQGITGRELVESSFFDAEDPYHQALEHVYQYYESQLKFYNAIDFDDILHLVVRLFHKYPEVAAKFSERYQYIMIDEYQDTNHLQFDMVKGLTSKHNNICVVGDDDQSIYAFRGADVEIILSFEKQFPGAKVIKLEQNYRSTQPILKLANKVIQQNKNRTDKSLWSDLNSDEKPLLWVMGDSDHEAAVIADEIVKVQQQGLDLNEVAILYRSNTQAPLLEEHMRLNSIPYRLMGGQKFFEKKEIKDLIAYLSVIQNPFDEISLRRILNVPARGIGQKTLEKFIELAKEKNSTLFNAMKNFSHEVPSKEKTISQFTSLIEEYQQNFKSGALATNIEALVNNIDFLHYIEKSYDHVKQIDLRKNDVILFIEAAKRFENKNQGANNLGELLERLLLQDNSDQKDEHENTNEVTLMTLHSSKGLEFDQVFLVGMEEEILPHKRVIQENDDIAEELRLAYVGITRARKKLIMTYAQERTLYGKKYERHKSRFISELKDSEFYIEQNRNTLSHLSEAEANDYKKSFIDNLIQQL